MRSMVLTLLAAGALLAASAVLTATPVLAADDSKVKAATRQVEDGARKIGSGSVGRGAEETGRGAWRHTREGAVAFGQSVKRFFTTLFSN